MAQGHEDYAAELHQTLNERIPNKETDLAGGYIAPSDLPDDRKASIPGSGSSSAEHEATPDGDEPNDHEKATLRRVGDKIPAAAFLIAIVELAERFTYYGAQGIFQNYIHQSASGTDGAAGLGLGGQAATGLNQMFTWLCYTTPFLGAVLADQVFGRYKTIVIFCVCYWVGLLILWTTALPTNISSGHALPGFIVAIVIIGFGTGGIKSNIAPLIADQLAKNTMEMKTERSGERVIIDPAITIQRVYMIFYWCINLGALSLIATPFIEKATGFWAAFLMCFGAFNIAIAVLVLCRKKYVVRAPQGGIILDAFRAIGIMIKNRNTDAPKPSWRLANGNTKPVNWNDHFVDELKRALRACKVFLLFPIWWVCYGQFSSNFVSQAALMNGHGMPNDFMQNWDPISILVFVPILDRLVFPALRKAGFELRPIFRISVGFTLAGLSLAYAAIVQHLIYSAGPCYDHPAYNLGEDQHDLCPAGFDAEGNYIPNNVHIAVQTPAYMLIGIAEIFISVTGLEYAYTKAPASMKSFVQSIYLFTNAIGAALNAALVPVLVDPKILWMYTGVGVTSVVTAFVSYAIFHKYDREEDKMYDLDRDQPALQKQGVKDIGSDDEKA